MDSALGVVEGTTASEGRASMRGRCELICMCDHELVGKSIYHERASSLLCCHKGLYLECLCKIYIYIYIYYLYYIIDLILPSRPPFTRTNDN